MPHLEDGTWVARLPDDLPERTVAFLDSERLRIEAEQEQRKRDRLATATPGRAYFDSGFLRVLERLDEIEHKLDTLLTRGPEPDASFLLSGPRVSR